MSPGGDQPHRPDADEGAPPLTFPDLPRLELDELLGQLVDRAQEVMGTQGRLRGLLRASQTVTRDLTLPAVLERIVESARELIGAQYAALGVISPAGGLAEFIHCGMPADAVDRIGHLPEGKGLLGALIEDPGPIRLRRISADARSVGFPAGHPPMNSFLGVPILVRDEVFGNLYLAESTRGEFSAEDEELAKALAATAGVAIENARLYEAAQSRGEWLQAIAAVTRQVLATDPDDAADSLELIARTSLRVSRADLITVVLPDGPDELLVEVAVGAGAENMVGVRMPAIGSLSGQVLASGKPLRQLRDGSEGQGEIEALQGLDVEAVLAVPLQGSARIHGVLWAARRRGGPEFGAEEVDMAASFANQAALAIELAEARAEQERAAMLDERERIAADLHDHVIQRLFAAGLSLQSAAASLGPGKATDRIVATVDDLDATIRQIRPSIFQLQQIPQAPARGLRARLVGVATDLAPVLGFEPDLRLSGVLDLLPDDLSADVVAVVRESLSNVARHARAGSVEVDVTVTGDRLTVDVRDDGVGLGDGGRRSGLENLRRRADRHGGSMEVQRQEPSGTRLHWSVPLG